MDNTEISEILKALGHPVRLRMVDGIDRHGCNVGKIVDKLKLPQSTVSQHLAILRSHKIITARKTGLRVCYEVTNHIVKDILSTLRKKGVL